MQKEWKRCRLTVKGVEQLPRAKHTHKNRLGHVVGETKSGLYRVLWDNCESTQTYPKNYIDLNPVIVPGADKNSITFKEYLRNVYSQFYEPEDSKPEHFKDWMDGLPTDRLTEYTERYARVKQDMLGKNYTSEFPIPPEMLSNDLYPFKTQEVRPEDIPTIIH